MKTLLISFQPYWYEQIKSGEKIYEYRTAFPSETVTAYMYVSKPVQAIIGYAVFSGRIPLSQWADDYRDNPEILSRIEEFMERIKYVSEIIEFIETKPILLSNIKKVFPKFVIPQSYYYLDNYPELFEYIKRETEFTECRIANSFEITDESKICSLRRN